MLIDFFGNQRRPVQIVGKVVEDVVFSRAGRSVSRFKLNFIYKALCQDNTVMVDGDTLIDGPDVYFAVAVRQMYRWTEAVLYKANATVDVVDITKHFTGNTQDGLQEVPLVSATPTLYETVNEGMKQLEPGLLPTTVKRFLFSTCGVDILDRIKHAGVNYQVDAVDDSSFTGFLSVQASYDKRVTK